MCARVDLEKKGHPVPEQVLNSIADELLYFPEDLKVFSQSGCKKVSSKVDYIINYIRPWCGIIIAINNFSEYSPTQAFFKRH